MLWSSDYQILTRHSWYVQTHCRGHHTSRRDGRGLVVLEQLVGRVDHDVDSTMLSVQQCKSVRRQDSFLYLSCSHHRNSELRLSHARSSIMSINTRETKSQLSKYSKELKQKVSLSFLCLQQQQATSAAIWLSSAPLFLQATSYRQAHLAYHCVAVRSK